MNTLYKFSKYNIFVDNGGEQFVYNLQSCELFVLNIELYSYLKHCNDNNETVDPLLFDEELLQELYKKFVLLKCDENELDLARFEYNRDKYDDTFISLVIIPTLKCNFNCHYCYEKSKTQIISNDNFSLLKNYLLRESNSKKFIATRWSGGEPLLVWDRIYEFSKEVIAECNKNECNYISSIITNGYLITEKIIDEMLESNIRSVQITLDGPPEKHNKIRFLKDGTPSFSQILKSIELVSQKIKVILRLNIDKDNFTFMDELFLILAKSNINKENVFLFCKPVMCSIARTPKNPTFTNYEFFEVEKQLLSLANKYGLIYSFHWGVKSRKTRCLYHSLSGYMIDPNLKLYKCPIYIGGNGSHNIGHIDKEGMHITNRPEFLKCISYSPFDLEECRQCKVLPICNGKCPVFWELSGQKNDEGCIADKYTFTEKLISSLNSKFQLEALFRATIN